MYGNGMYRPYYGNMPNFGRGLGGSFFTSPSRGGFLRGLRGSFNLGSILNNAQKTLGVINQAIPVVKQAGPMINNVKTMFKLAGAFKDETEVSKKNNQKVNTNITSSETNNTTYSYSNTNTNNVYDNQPEFFI